MGSRYLGLSAVADINGDGADEIILPAFGRYSVVVLSMAAGQWRELDTLMLDSPVVSDIRVLGEYPPKISFCLADGACVERQLGD